MECRNAGLEWEGAGVKGNCAGVRVQEKAVVDLGVCGAEEEGYRGGEAGVGGGGAVGEGDSRGVGGEVGCCGEGEDCTGDADAPGEVKVPKKFKKNLSCNSPVP